MGCAGSSEVPPAKKNLAIKNKAQGSPSIGHKSHLKSSKSSSPNAKLGQSRSPSSPKKEYLRGSSQKSLKNSTTSIEKTPKKAGEGTSSYKNMRNLHQGMQISESKIKL